MSKEQPHELQEQQPEPQQSPDQPQQSHQQEASQQHAVPAEPQPSHDHVPGRDTAAEHHPPSYEQARAAPAGQPPANMPPGQAAQTVTPLNQLGDMSQWIDCPFCHKRTKTTVRKEGGSMQFIVGAVLCLVCVCLTCLPCLLHWFEDTDWYCSECNAKVAMRKNEGAVQVLGPAQVVYSQYGHQQPMENSQHQQQQPQQAASQNDTQQSVPQHSEISQQQNSEIQVQARETPAQPPADAKI
ncbi:LPS-induced tumor necrosis factor alpha factor [Cordyceps javanica]|uniref:LPS-induced tumor necrosis factor alpha factor n=1 Tax=Cordyceps javanica TaxID=43265 RepID=A0A545UMV5_9HYPO|nr:LPS-induced tumor necrosis factor alpha factor [Cordyceps javanica]TQW02428.1 LPS-induced tumor necrosis factor alpha factor [Cordyceps javanica]